MVVGIFQKVSGLELLSLIESYESVGECLKVVAFDLFLFFLFDALGIFYATLVVVY